ncbi:hypothetical protein GGS20DRAFT_563976 [Poronia punctata]|nr:hypothetical protein GGS20DRAFT_563976 [Poronia punctata]
MAENPSTSSQPLTMTPELERILARGREIHPTMPADWTGDMGCYDESMDPFLPKLDDKPGILRFLGLNDDTIEWALEKHQKEQRPDIGKDLEHEPLVAKFMRDGGDRMIEGVTFPMLDSLWDTVRRRDTEMSFDVTEDYDGFVRGGLMEGLRPEFAIFCGLHPSEEDYARETYREYHYIRGYQEQADEIIGLWAIRLSNLWTQKLERLGLISQHKVTLKVPRTES